MKHLNHWRKEGRKKTKKKKTGSALHKINNPESEEVEHIDLLSQWLCQNQNVKGIFTLGGEQKLALFADSGLIY